MAILSIANPTAMGVLVKAWAAGTKPLPTTVEVLKQQAAGYGVGLKLSDNSTNLVFINRPKMTDEDVVIILPHKDDIEQSGPEPGPGPYPLDIGYDVNYNSPSRRDLSDGEKEQFHCLRIGEYTTAKCR